jgi:hypothetical protein
LDLKQEMQTQLFLSSTPVGWLDSKNPFKLHPSILVSQCVRGFNWPWVVKAAGWYAGDPGSILGRDGHVYLSAVSILGMDMCAIQKFFFSNFIDSCFAFILLA